MEGFAKLVRPLYELMRKEQKWEWELKQGKSFKALKKQFMTELILIALNLDKKMRIEVDVSDFVTVGILSMEDNDGKWRLEAYLSKLLNKTERNHEIHDKEILAVIMELEK